MKTKKDTFTSSLSHAETIHFAIMYLGPKCVEGIEKIKAYTDNEPEIKKTIRKMYAPWFFKTKKLCELYELETGSEYNLEAGFGINISDLEID